MCDKCETVAPNQFIAVVQTIDGLTHFIPLREVLLLGTSDPDKTLRVCRANAGAEAHNLALIGFSATCYLSGPGIVYGPGHVSLPIEVWLASDLKSRVPDDLLPIDSAGLYLLPENPLRLTKQGQISPPDAPRWTM